MARVADEQRGDRQHEGVGRAFRQTVDPTDSRGVEDAEAAQESPGTHKEQHSQASAHRDRQRIPAPRFQNVS